MTSASTPVRLSRASIGRLLQEMDHRGLTERNKFAGRRITNLGRNALYRHLNESAIREGSHNLLKILTEGNKKCLLEVLHTRRGLERETARLAAENISEEEITELEASLGKHQAALLRGESAIEEDREFHRIIAPASRNEVMEQVLEVIVYDLIIRGGTVVDGSGAKGRPADVGVSESLCVTASTI